MIYYNDNDPAAAAWLRQLIADRVIPAGYVDDRSIWDVRPIDLAGYQQCHFFAGIAGWAHALILARWPLEIPVWTGSCPCQPFSVAGRGARLADKRHLWPAFDWLIGECQPDLVFGEQVPNATDWLDVVSGDLEGKGYTFGASVLGAHSVGAPHIRQRLFWVGHTDGPGLERWREYWNRADQRFTWPTGVVGELGDVGRAGSGRDAGAIPGQEAGARRQVRGKPYESRPSGQTFWSDADWLDCRDGKIRPVEPGTFPLAHGIPERVGLIRGYGNAIVPQTAATFIRAVGDTLWR